MRGVVIMMLISEVLVGNGGCHPACRLVRLSWSPGKRRMPCARSCHNNIQTGQSTNNDTIIDGTAGRHSDKRLFCLLCGSELFPVVLVEVLRSDGSTSKPIGCVLPRGPRSVTSLSQRLTKPLSCPCR